MSCAVKSKTIQNSLHMVCMIKETVDGNAMLINLNQSKAFDRVDHGFLEAVLTAIGFGLYSRSWIRLLNATSRVMVEVNGVRLKAFILTRSICESFPLSPMLYVLALERLQCRLRANPVIRSLTLPGTTEMARYTAYTDGVSVLVTNSAELLEKSKEIARYEVVTGTKINREKSVSLGLGSWKGCAITSSFSWKDGSHKTLGVWFSPDLQRYWKRS